MFFFVTGGSRAKLGGFYTNACITASHLYLYHSGFAVVAAALLRFFVVAVVTETIGVGVVIFCSVFPAVVGGGLLLLFTPLSSTYDRVFE